MEKTTTDLVLPARRRWTRLEYERAADLGVFQPDERLELIEGEIVHKVTQNTPHSTGVGLLQEALRIAFAEGFYLRIQQPLAVSDSSEPEPDVAVVCGTPRDYAATHPATAELIVEVADTSLAVDRSTKAALYARAGVPEYWILNLKDATLEVHRQPGPMAEQPLGHHYHHIACFGRQDTICPLNKPSCAIRVADLLP